MELLKRNIVLHEGGAAGGNSIDIEQKSVSSTAGSIMEQQAILTTAFNEATAAVATALAAFDDGDSNKAALKAVLENGTKDIEDATNKIKEFADRLSQSSNEWDRAENEIREALEAALKSIGSTE